MVVIFPALAFLVTSLIGLGVAHDLRQEKAQANEQAILHVVPEVQAEKNASMENMTIIVAPEDRTRHQGS